MSPITPLPVGPLHMPGPSPIRRPGLPELPTEEGVPSPVEAVPDVGVNHRSREATTPPKLYPKEVRRGGFECSHAPRQLGRARETPHRRPVPVIPRLVGDPGKRVANPDRPKVLEA